jgi:predicted RNase H-like nuclease (RuvC/YqgF family)
MDTETRAAITALGESMGAAMNAGFARIERYIELQRGEFLESRDEMRGEFEGLRGGLAVLRNEVSELRDRVEALTERVSRLEQEVAQLRDFVTREIAEIRLELRALRARSDQTDELRRDIAQLTMRVDRLERRQQG